MKKPLVSVIIPTYNRKEKLTHCLDSIFNNTYKDLEVIVINDNPKEDLADYLSRFNIKLIQHKKEKYWVLSRNEGAKVAKGKILFFIDDDNILEPNTISLMVKKYSELKKIGLLGPLMYNTDKTLWFYGAKTNWINPYAKPVSRTNLKKDLIETDVIPNAYMISKRLYLKIGMENPIFLHHEELDLAERLKRNGYQNYIYTKASTVHDHGGVVTHINPFRLYIVTKGHITIERKYAPRWKFVIFVLIYLPINMAFYFFYKIPFILSRNKLDYYKSYINGLKDGFRSNIS